MRILSLHLVNHDANVTYFDGEKAHYINIERVKQIKKYHYYKWNFPKLLDDLRGMNIPEHVDVLTVCVGEQIFSKEQEALLNWEFKNGEFLQPLEEWQFESVFENLPVRADKYYRVEHHYGHYMSAEWMYNTGQGVIIDGCGDYGNHTSVFKGDKKVISYTHRDMLSIGDLYYETAGNLLGRGTKKEWENTFADKSGNLMGLISYGHFNEHYAKQLRELSFEDFPAYAINVWQYWTKGIPGVHDTLTGHVLDALSNDKRTYSEVSKEYPMSMLWVHEDGHPHVRQYHTDWMRTWQDVLAEKMIEFFSRYFTEHDEFVYSGGVAHNVVINEKLAKAFPKMKIPPCIGDEGQSLGSMYAVLKEYNIEAECPTHNWSHENIKEMSKETAETVANHLLRNDVIAVCQGASEIGPRALGNRSIIYRPDQKYAAHYFNDRGLKNREFWRPYGIIILEEELSNYLQTETLSPYMLYVATPTELGREKLSGVIHIDGTVRYQTVNSGPYYHMLKKLQSMCGVAAIVNTSLNSHGKPICQTTADVLEFVHKYNPDGVVIEDYLYLNNARRSEDATGTYV